MALLPRGLDRLSRNAWIPATLLVSILVLSGATGLNRTRDSASPPAAPVSFLRAFAVPLGTSVDPAPSITGVGYPASISLGQSATINISATNAGNLSKWQTIAVSFPNDPPTANVAVAATNMASSSVTGPGVPWPSCYSLCTLNTSYPFAQGLQTNWSTGQSHYLLVTVTPTGVGTFTFYYKTVAAGYLSTYGYASNWDPTTGTTDQQHEYVYTDSISVTSALNLSLRVTPASISLGEATTLSATVSGGVPPFSYSYAGLPNGCSISSVAVSTCTPSEVGAFVVTATVLSASGAVAHARAHLTVQASLQVGSNFTKGSLNLSGWSFDSNTLQRMASFDAVAWGLNVSLGVPTLPLGSGGKGLGFSLAGVQTVSGLTDNYVVTPPFTATVVIDPASTTGGNPAMACLSNGNATSYLCVFLSTQVYVQNGSTSPVGLGGTVSLGTVYTIAFAVGASSAGITVSSSGGSVAWKGAFPSSAAEAYYLMIGSLAGVFPGERVRSTYSEQTYVSSVAVSSNASWNLTVQVVGVSSTGVQSNDSGVRVSIFNQYLGLNDSVGSVLSDRLGRAAFAGLLSGEYAISASQTQVGWPIPVLADSSVILGSPSSPTLRNLSLTLYLRVPAVTALSLSITTAAAGNAPLTTLTKASTNGGTHQYSYAWSLNRVAVGANQSTFSHTFRKAGVYHVSLTVSCYGTWFGQSCPSPSTAIGSTTYVVNQNDYNATLTALSGSSIFQVSSASNGTPNEALLETGGGAVSVLFNATVSFSGITLPSWLTGFLGLSTPYYEVYVGYNSTPSVASSSLVELQSAPPTGVDVQLPSSTPSTFYGLESSQLTLTANPSNSFAEVADLVSILSAYLGLKGATADAPFLTSLAEFLIFYAAGDVAGILEDPVSGITGFVGNIVGQVEQFVESSDEFLAQTAITTYVHDLSVPWAVADLVYDATTLLGATLKGSVSETFVVSI
jgi:hypothetical protein